MTLRTGLRRTPGERLLRLAMLAHPRAFREVWREEMLDYYRQGIADAARPVGRLRFTGAAVAGALRTGLHQRAERRVAARRRRPVGPRRPRSTAMETWLDDLRSALSVLRRAPLFAVLVVGTLALGLGANTAVFSVLREVVLRPLPYEEPGQLVRVYQADIEQPEGVTYLTLPAAVTFRDQAQTIDGLAALYDYSPTGADLLAGDRPERIKVLPVGADYFQVLRTQPMLGRPFERTDELADARVVVVSEALWRRVLDEDPGAPGRSLSLDGVPLTVIGVMPAGFEDPINGAIDAWLPLALPTDGWQSWQWDNHYLSAVARLRPGATVADAQRELDALSRGLAEVGVDLDPQGAWVVPLGEDVVGRADTLLFVLMGAVGLLLLVACVNVAGLILARGADRRRELAVRAALGSSGGRLARQLLVECLILAVLGGTVGLAAGLWITRLLVRVAPSGLLGSASPPFDGQVFGFCLAVALASGLLFGLVPALRLSRPHLAGLLREGGGASTDGRSSVRARSALVVAELALSLVLLIGAGILLRTLQELHAVDLALEANGVETFTVYLPDLRYAEAADRIRFHDELERRLASLPGVRAAGAVSRLPATGRFHSWGTRRALADGVPADEDNVQADQRVVAGNYFGALRIPLLAGRLFEARDDGEAPRVVVVNQALVRQLFGDENPIGRLLRLAGGYPTIVGVVGDVPVTARGEVVPKVYHSHAQFADNRNWDLTQVVSLDGARPGWVDEARRVLAEIDPELVLFQPQPLAAVIGHGIGAERFALGLLAAFAALAVLLAALGVFGVLATTVRTQRREIGLRMALGARAGEILRLVLGRAATLSGVGIALGIGGALVATRWLEALVFGVSVTDGLVFAAASVSLAAAAALACALPIRSALRVDPVESFRE